VRFDRERCAGTLQLGLGRGDPTAAAKEVEDRLVASRFRLLRQVAHAQRWGCCSHRAGVGNVESREQAEQRGLADAVRTDDAEAAARPDVDVHRVEHRRTAARRGEATSNE
jgi:hypothetical protein